MSLVYDEYEEYEYRARAVRRPEITSNKENCSNLSDPQRLQAKMRTRPSYKSEHGYRRQRRHTGHDLIVQKLAEMSLERQGKSNRDNAFDSADDEIDCDFPDDVFDDGFGDTTNSVPTWHMRSRSEKCKRTVRVRVDVPSPVDSRTRETSSYSNKQAHHHRSKSCRIRASRPRDKQFVSRQETRRRTYSVPSRSHRPNGLNGHTVRRATSEDDDDDDMFYVVRTFSTSAKGIINRGDSFKKKPLSAQSSSDGSKSDSSKQRTLSATSHDSSYGSADDSGLQDEPYTVLVMGNNGVGKTALIRQFMSSEYMGNADHALDESTLPSVSVLLDGVESTLEFADITDAEEVTTNCSVEAFVVVFAVNDRDSFDDAIMCLHELRKKALLDKTATILVANKGDIVRGRDVEEEEGKVMAVRYGCKYTEVSAIINLKVDELLVGILKQIRLNDQRKLKNSKGSRSNKTTSCITQDNGCIPQPRRIVGKILRRQTYSFSSCDNLLVL